MSVTPAVARRATLGDRLGRVYGIRLLRDAGVQRAVLALLAVLVLGFRAIQLVVLSGSDVWGYDFSSYWFAGRHLLDGEPLYADYLLSGPYVPQGQGHYLYPPLLAVLTMPLAALFPTDYRAAALVWSVVAAGVLAVAVVVVARRERITARRRDLALLLAAAFAFPPVVGELAIGNVHLFLVGLLALMWLGIRGADTRGDAIAGTALAAAVLIKVFPALLVVWLVATRRWRVIAWSALAGVALIVLTLPFTGIEPWLRFPVVLLNQGRPADVTDALSPTVWLSPLLGYTAARMLVLTLAVAVIVWSVRRGSEAASFGVAVTCAVLVTPSLFHHYLSILVLPMLLSLASGAGRGWLAAGYLAMWGGQQAADELVAALLNRVRPSFGALAVVIASTRRAPSGDPAPD